jgi:hypothetical protein
MRHGRQARFCFAAAWVLLQSGGLFAQSVFRQGGEFQVNRSTVNNQYDPSVAVDAEGDFVVVWTDAIKDSGGKGIFGLRFNSAGVIQATEFRVNTYTPNAQHRAVVAAENNGDFVVAWQSNGQSAPPNFYTIFGQRFTSAGAPVAVEFQVNSSTAFYSLFPKIASDADGDFVVAWESRLADPNTAVFARRFNSSGAALGDEFRVNTFTANKQGNPAVASDADGDFVVVWESFNQIVGGSYDVFAKRFNSAGAVLAAEFQVNSYTSNSQYVPAIAAEADGDFTVAWQSNLQEGPAAGSIGIFARRFSSSGGGLAIEFMVNTYTTGTQRKPQIGGDDNGDFVVSWESVGQDGSVDGTFARRVSAAGAAFGPEFQVNTHTMDDQKQIFTNSPLTNGQAVNFDADGDFVIAWTTEYQDGNAGAVFAQRFSLPPLATLDIDGNGILEPLSDGLLNLRHRFGFSGNSLTTGAVSAGCTRCAAADITAYLNGLGLVLDIDNNGALDPLTDGLLVLRFMFGFTGSSLTNNAVAGNCVTRCDAATILAYLQTLD